MLWALALGIAGMASLMAIALFYFGLKESNKKASRSFLVWAVIFLGASLGGIEWAFYLLGYNLFTFFAFPLAAYIAVWFAWVIWVFERRGERKIWLIFLIILIALTILALSCTNCLATYSLA